MKNVMLACLLAAVVGGCGAGGPTPDQLSPQALAVATHRAIETRNRDTLVGLTTPPYQKPMRDVLVAIDDYAREADKTAALVAQRIGQAPADRLRNETADFYRQLFPLPFQEAAEGDTVDWTRVDIREDDKNTAWVHVDGLRSPFHKIFVLLYLDGAWFVEPLDMPEEFAAAAKRLADNYRSAAKTLQKIQAELRTDNLTEADITLRLWPPQ